MPDLRQKPKKWLRNHTRRGLSGQGALEFALLLPLFLLLLLAVIQFGVVIYGQQVVTGAAQEGARAAAQANKGVNDGLAVARNRLEEELGSVKMDFQGDDDGEKVYIQAAAVIPAFLPFLDRKIHFNLKARAEMLKERWRA